MGLAEKAAALAAGQEAFQEPLDEQAPLIDFNVPDPDPDGYEQIPPLLAWLRVRADIKSIAKERVFAGQNWKFRGIDEALNAFGPVTLRHGVNVIPHRVEPSFRDARTSQGKPTRECTVTVTWRIYGPTGEFFEAQTIGESLDSGDRGSSKAQAIARRELLFGGGLIPTGDPNADVSTIERGDAPVRTAVSYASEALDEATSVGRLRQMHKEIVQNRLTGALVRNEHGSEEQLGALVVRVGRERKERPADPWATPLPQHEGPHDESGFGESCKACRDESSAIDQANATGGA